MTACAATIHYAPPALALDETRNVSWIRFRQTGDICCRRALAENYLPLVRYHAKRLHDRLPPLVERDDLVSAGYFGLDEAIGKFDPGRGVRFENFAIKRIRYSMIDYLRDMDYVPKCRRRKASRGESLKEHFRQFAGRSASEEELAGLFGTDDPAVVRRHDAVPSIGSLSRKRLEGDEGHAVITADLMADVRAAPPGQSVARREVIDLLTAGLPADQRLVLVLYYVQDLTMRVIAQTIGVTESRVSQLHQTVLKRLRRHPDAKRLMDLLQGRDV